jgi:hypothetical protein
MVKTGGEYLGALRVEDRLGDFPLMSLEYGSAGEGGYVVKSHGRVNAGGDEVGADGVEVEVQYLIGVSLEDGHALARTDVPKSAGLVDGCRAAHVASELELCAGDLPRVALQGVDGLSGLGVPDLSGGRGTIAVPSKEPVRILSPSALKLRETIYPSWPLRVECSLPV